MASDPHPNIQILEDIPHPEAVIRRFLYYAIYIPPNVPSPEFEIVDQPNLNHYYVNWGREGDFAVYAVLNDNVIGVTWIRLFPADSPGYGTINPTIPELSIAVLSDFRNRGIGSRLLKVMLTRIQPQFKSVSLSVAAANPAKHLYERFGFSIYARKEETFLMQKTFESIAPLSDRD